MTGILKVALQRNEEKIACILTAYYELNLSKEMIFRGIANDHFLWLKFLWGFTKNVVGPRAENDFFHFEHLFKDMIHFECEDKIA